MEAALATLAKGGAAAFLAVLFARAALHKASDRAHMQGLVADYALFPEQAAAPAVIALIALESLCPLMLAIPALTQSGATLACALLLLYALAMAINLLRGRREIDCGCGGESQHISWTLVARNVALAACASLVSLSYAPPSGFAAYAGIWAAAAAAWTCWLVSEQLAGNHARMRATTPSYVFPTGEGAR
jgi:hypothetical protein